VTGHLVGFAANPAKQLISGEGRSRCPEANINAV
jgi:hypothetical protein